MPINYLENSGDIFNSIQVLQSNSIPSLSLSLTHAQVPKFLRVGVFSISKIFSSLRALWLCSGNGRNLQVRFFCLHIIWWLWGQTILSEKKWERRKFNICVCVYVCMCLRAHICLRFWNQSPVKMKLAVPDRRKQLQSRRETYIFTRLQLTGTGFNLLKPTGYVMHHQFNIQQL